MAENIPPSPVRQAPIRVLVIDDSPTVQEFLTYLLLSDPEIQVVGTADNGEDALAAIQSNRPDIVTMDLHMPKMNGFAATRKIMENCPLPIIIVTGSSTGDEVSKTFHALEAGALAVVKRPFGIGHPQHAAMAQELIRTLKLMAEVKVIRRWAIASAMPRQTPSAAPIHAIAPQAEISLVAIGSSTGGPPVLQQILSALPKNFPVPIVLVQHIADGFAEGFATWLRDSCALPVSLAEHNLVMQPGHAYVAPGNFHTVVDATGRIKLLKDIPENGHCPSVSRLFRSVADVYGPHAVGVLLTGMGKDGAAELALMKQRGALTIAQDKDSSVIHGMPGEAIALGAATYVLAPDKIAAALADIKHCHSVKKKSLLPPGEG